MVEPTEAARSAFGPGAPPCMSTDYCVLTSGYGLLTSLDALLGQLRFEGGGDRRVEAGLGAGVLLALGGDVVVALLFERDYLVAYLPALGETALDLLLALVG